jgi:hypothetical protein
MKVHPRSAKAHRGERSLHGSGNERQSFTADSFPRTRFIAGTIRACPRRARRAETLSIEPTGFRV